MITNVLVDSLPWRPDVTSREPLVYSFPDISCEGLVPSGESVRAAIIRGCRNSLLVLERAGIYCNAKNKAYVAR